MQTKPKTYKVTIGEDSFDITLNVAVVETDEDLGSIPREDIRAAMNFVNEYRIKRLLDKAKKVEGANEQTVLASVREPAAEFDIYKPGPRGRGASNTATQKDAAEGLKALKETLAAKGKELTKDEYNAVLEKIAAELGA